jgi:hypothetical protein
MTVMNPRRIVRAATTVVLGVAGVAALGGTAYAVWTTSGTGSGHATATSAQPLTTSAASVSSNLLFPGGTGDVKVTINNPNPFAVTVTAINSNGTITSDKGAACNAATGVTFSSTSGLSVVVAANGTATTTLAGKAAMSNASDNSCQGAVFTIPVALVGASS